MENIHFFENAIVAISTKKIDVTYLLEKLCDDVKSLFDVKDLIFSYIDKSGNEKIVKFSNCQLSEILEKSNKEKNGWVRGSLVINGSKSNKFIIRYSWNKFNRRKYDSIIKSNVSKHNEISLHFDSSSIISEEKKKQFISFCKNMSSLFQVDYLKAYSLKYDKRGQLGRPDLSNGIHDIYWLNIFGKPFVDIIGRDKLLNSPAYYVSEVDSERILLQSCEKFCHHGEMSKSIILDTIRSYIGEQYFYKNISRIDNESGVFSVSHLLKFLWAASVINNDDKEKADICPTYFYENMIY